MSESFNERLRMIRFRRKRERTRFTEELRLIPRWLVWTCAVAWFIAIVAATVVNLHGFQTNGPIFPDDSLRNQPVTSTLGLLGVITLMSLVLSSMFFMFGWVYRDAKRRGMHPGLWTLLVVILAPAYGVIGLIIYLIVREPLPFACPQCNTEVSARFNFCPNCKYNLHPACPQCQREVSDSDKFCPLLRHTASRYRRLCRHLGHRLRRLFLREFSPLLSRRSQGIQVRDNRSRILVIHVVHVHRWADRRPIQSHSFFQHPLALLFTHAREACQRRRMIRPILHWLTRLYPDRRALQPRAFNQLPAIIPRRVAFRAFRHFLDQIPASFNIAATCGSLRLRSAAARRQPDNSQH